VRLVRATSGVMSVALAAASLLGAQSIGSRVDAVKDGTVQMTYAARPDACGDGNDVMALGKLFIVYPSIQGHGWSNNASCFFGPVRVVVTRRDGETASVRTHIGRVRRATADTDLGTVSAREASSYFLEVASTASGRTANSAIMAAALADSVDIWRQLLALARNNDRPRDVRSAALYWMSGVAPAEAAPQLATLARNSSETRSLREGVLMTLAQLRDGAGVPTLIEFARRESDDEHWLREKSIFWLGNAQDDRARTTLRTLASSDTLARELRDQAIFALGFLDNRGGNGAFLRTLYGRVDDRRLKDKIIQSVAQSEATADQQWLSDRVLDAREPVDLRKQAMFWRGQNNSVPVRELIALYPKLDSRELKDQYVFVLSQRHESDAVDKMIDLARNDPDREVRAKALFWLGQSRDPRVARFLEEAISK
jgi:HEAT repeat protein